VDDGPFFVVNLFRFLIAEEEEDGSKKENGCPPTHPVCPSKLPDLAITLFDFRCKPGRVDDQCDEDGEEGCDHHPECEAVKSVLLVGILGTQSEPRHDSCTQVEQQTKHAESPCTFDVRHVPARETASFSFDPERQGSGGIFFHTEFPETLSKLVRGQPVTGGQTQDHEENYYDTTDKGDHLQWPDYGDSLDGRSRGHHLD